MVLFMYARYTLRAMLTYEVILYGHRPRTEKCGVATTILTGGVALPAVVTTIAGYLATASAVAVVVSQCTVDSGASFDVK